MKLYQKITKKYEDGSIRKIYQLETLKSCNELKGFLLSFQNKFGDMDCIIVKRYVGVNKVLFYGRYIDLYDFLEKFNLADIKEYNTYEFSCDNLHCVIDTEKNIINIFQSDYLSEPESDNYEYCKFLNSKLIIRYNKDNGSCYYLDNYNRWICEYSLQRFLDDAAYSYEIIDDPLKGLPAEELNKHYEKEIELIKQFKEFCCDIEFIEQ
ncbi:MAG: hypothetical protein NC452_02360 [Eubacterium sp.]|nr:hypothetical protein [Eubacterium sp.]